MPRQGARRKRAGSRPQRAKRPRVKVSDALEVCSAPLSGSAAVEAAAQAKDFEAALSAPGDTAEKLFELANEPAVRLSLGKGEVRIVQDRKTQEHSGGVVWETAYFLLRYLQQHELSAIKMKSSGRIRVAEVGAGCGLLGLSLAQLGCEVVLTDQTIALPNLRNNVAAQNISRKGGSASVEALSWGNGAEATACSALGPFDLVVGSDVVFAARLVEPLLDAIEALLRGGREEGSATCWLCLQQRDPDAHKALLEQAPRRFKVIEKSFGDLEGFEAAAELDCVLLKLRLLSAHKKRK